MKSRYSLSALLVVAVLGGSAVILLGGAGPGEAPSLPGARAEIDAAQYASLQAALEALPEQGGLVRLPAGEFEISEPLVIRTSDVTLIGAGTATHIKNMNIEGKSALILEHPQAKESSDNRLWRIHLANFRVTGNPNSGAGIEARLVNEIYVDGVTVSENGGDGVLLDHCYEDPRICSALITYNKGTGLNLLGCHDIVVSACQFEENHDALHCFDGFNLCMTGNCLDDHLNHGVVIENTYGSVVSGNMIEECAATAIILDRDCYGITVSANVIAHDGAGVDLRDAHGCAVSANTFTIMKTDAVRIGANSGRIAVTGNSFSNSYIGEDKVRRGENDLAAAGMTLQGTSDVAVTGNQFSSVRPFALAVSDGTKRVAVVGNVLTDVASQQNELKASVVDDNVLPAKPPSG